MAIVKVCPSCGLSSDEIRCPRCNTLKVVGCTGSCGSCGNSCKTGGEPCAPDATPPSETARDDSHRPGTPLAR